MSQEGERVRLFVALELPPEIRQALGRWLRDAWPEIRGMRALPDEHLHVTLCFLGWQRADAIDAVAGACAAVAGGEAPALVLGEPAWLPPRRPRVLAVRLRDSTGRLVAVQAQLSEHLQADGLYEPEARAYLPHVTVARAGKRTRVSAVSLPDPPAVPFTGRHLTLFRSRLSPRGASYEPLSRVALG